MIDATRLKELEEDVGSEGLREILDAFLADAEGAIIELRKMAACGPADACRDQLHYLKGCARNVGAARLGDLCERLEAAASVFSDADLEQLQTELRSVRHHFSDECWRDAG